MNIGYVTTDLVNESIATDMADECGATLVPLIPNQTAPDGDYDAVLYDLDFLPPEQQQQILRNLARNKIRRVGVHSYQLKSRDARAMRRRGVAVFRRLGTQVIQWLSAGVAAGRV
jgi:hypothetical protein